MSVTSILSHKNMLETKKVITYFEEFDSFENHRALPRASSALVSSFHRNIDHFHDSIVEIITIYNYSSESYSS